MKNILRILALMIIGVSALIIFTLTRKTEYNQIVEIKKGESISKSLKSLPVSKEFMFKLYLKLIKNQGKNIKAGYYELKDEYSIISLVEVLESGKDKVYRLQFQKDILLLRL